MRAVCRYDVYAFKQGIIYDYYHLDNLSEHEDIIVEYNDKSLLGDVFKVTTFYRYFQTIEEYRNQKLDFILNK